MKPHDVLNPSDPKQQLLIMSQPTVKTEADSPATDALDFILQSEDPASLMLDLTDLLKRDPTLASLDDASQGFSGMPIPKKSPDRPSQFNDVNLDLGGGNNAIGTGLGGFGHPGSSYGSAVTASPLASTSPSMWETTQATVKMETDPGFYVPHHQPQPQPTLAQLNSAGALDENSLRLLGEVENLDSYFVTSDSGNVTLSGAGMDYNDRPTVIKQETSVHPDDGLLFSTSFSNHSGGAVFGSKDLLSSSVPGSIFHNSPLSDILGDISSAASPSSVSPNHNQSPSHAGPERVSTLHKLLLKKDPVLRPSPVRSPESRKTLGKMRNSLSASNPLLSQQLSKSAPTHSSYLDRLMWSRREPRQHISSVCSVGGESSIADEVSDVLSGLSPNELPDIVSDDEEEGEEQDTQRNEQMEQETSSDEGMMVMDLSVKKDLSDNEEGTSPNNKSGGSKKERYFWQYNVQAKGPKGQKIVVETKMEDPHVLNEIVDPVFSGDVQLQGIKHSGKARRGDGNDLTSNPKKLAAIGRELDQLNKVINDLTPVSEMPFTARCKSRKEKNKLASRACRLKKKAQHEANKLKIHGLEDEHKMLNQTLSRMRELLREKLDPNSRTPQEELSAEIDNLLKKSQKLRVAGQTTEYVNRMIDRYNGPSS